MQALSRAAAGGRIAWPPPAQRVPARAQQRPLTTTTAGAAAGNDAAGAAAGAAPSELGSRESSSRESARALTRRIQHAISAAELLQLHGEHRQQLDALHVCALLRRLVARAPLSRSVINAGQHEQQQHDSGAQLLAALLAHDVARVLPRMQPRAVSSTLAALGKLQATPPPELLHGLLFRAHRQLGFASFQARQLCDIAHALVVLPPPHQQLPWTNDSSSTGAGWDPSLLDDLFGALGDCLWSCSAQDASQAVLAVARLRHVPSLAWLRQWLLRAHQLLPHFTPQGLANAAYGLVRVLQLMGGLQAPRSSSSGMQQQLARQQQQQVLAASQAWLEACLRVAVVHVGHYQPRELIGQLLWAAARLSCRLHQPVHHHLLAAAQGMLAHCDARHLSTALFVLAHLGWPAGQQQQQQQQHEPGSQGSAWAHELWDSLAPQVASLAPRDLAQLLWAAARLQLQPPEAVRYRLLRHAMRLLSPSSSSISISSSRPREVVTTARAMAALGWRLPRRYLLLLQGSLEPQLQHCQPQDYANCLWALATAHARVDSRWLDSLLLASHDRLPQFQPQELANTAWALARLRHCPSRPWLQQLLRASLARMPAFSPRDHAHMLWALAGLGCRPSPLWLGSFWAASSPSLSAGAGFGPTELHALLLAASRLALRPPAEWLRAAAAAVEGSMGGFTSQQLLEVLQALNVLWRACEASSDGSSSNVVEFRPTQGRPRSSGEHAGAGALQQSVHVPAPALSSRRRSVALRARVPSGAAAASLLQRDADDAYGMACLVLLMPPGVRSRVQHFPRLLAAELQQQRGQHQHASSPAAAAR